MVCIMVDRAEDHTVCCVDVDISSISREERQGRYLDISISNTF